MEHTVEELQQNLEDVLKRIEAAAMRANRDPKTVRLIAVTKTHPISTLETAQRAGMHVFGENRPQELAEKASALGREIHWCAIGTLQRNKAKEVAQFANEFHALDSQRLAEALQRRLDGYERTLDVFIQVNCSNEEQKGGIQPEELPQFLADLQQFDRLNIRGLMTLAEHTKDESIIRQNFRLLRELRDEHLPGAELSMGMSGDFELAIEEGATSVRVGSALFGARA